MRFFIVAGLIWFSSIDVLAATVKLNSGKVIEGTITSRSDQKILINPGVGVAVSYYKDEIATIDGRPFAEYPAVVAGKSEPVLSPSEDGILRETDNPLYLRVKQLFKENYVEQGFDRYPSPVIDSKMLIPWENDPAILNIIEKNHATIVAFQAAAAQDNSGSLLYKIPALPNAQTESPIKLLFELLKLNNLNLVQARYALAQGDYVGAEKSIAASIDFMIQLAAQRPAQLLVNIMNNIVFDKTEPLLNVVLKDSKFSPAFSDQIIERLMRIDRTVSFEEILEGERQYMRGTLTAYEAKAKKEASYDPAYWKAFNRKFEALKDEENALLLQYVNNAQPAVGAKKALEIWRVVLKETVSALDDQSLGQPEDPEAFPFPQDLTHAEQHAAFLCLHTPFTLETLDFLNAHNAKYRNFIVAFALRKYRADIGRYPDDLSTLVPEYLAQIPQDMFDSLRPLKYVKDGDGYRVYSLGPDRIDQSGLTAVDFSDAGYGGDKTKNQGDVVFAYEGRQ